MEYIKLHAYHEANQDRGDLKHTHNVLRDNIDAEDHSESEDRVRVHLQHRRRRSSVSSMASEGTSSISKASLLMKAAASTTTDDNYKIANLKQVDKPSPAAATELPSTEPVLMMGVMEVYPSDEDDDDEEYVYVTETETESEGEGEEEEEKEEEDEEEIEVIEAKHQNEHSPRMKENATLQENVQEPIENTQPDVAAAKETKEVPLALQKEVELTQDNQDNQDKKVNRLKSAYQEIKKDRQPSPSSLLAKQPFNPQRRVSFIEDNESAIDILKANKPALTSNGSTRIADPTNVPHKMSNNTNTMSMYAKNSSTQDTQEQAQDEEDDEEDYEGTSESAAFELDDMLRELDSKRIVRNDEESMRYNRRPDIKPTASISSPSLLQQQQQRRRSIPSQYFQQPQYQSSRRMSSVEPSRPQYSQTGSIHSSNSSGYMDLYDPFNSLSSKEIGTISSKGGSIESNTSKSIPPSVQMMHERMLKDKQTGSYHGSVSSSSSSGSGSVQSIGQQAYNNDKFIQDYYSVGSKTSMKTNENEGYFIDFGTFYLFVIQQSY